MPAASPPASRPSLPPGRYLSLPGRGRLWLWDHSGPPGAPVVVLLHGWTATAALNWSTSFDALGQHFRVLAPDHRGHGRGIASPWPFRLEDCADDVAALAGELGLRRLIVVGYSMGGPIAQLVWRRHPELTSALVLCATAQHFSPHRPGGDALGAVLLGLSVAASVIPPGLRRRAVGPLVARQADPQDPRWWTRPQWRGGDPVALAQAGLRLERFDSRPWSHSIDAPTAVIVTENDTRVPPADQNALAAAIPGALRLGIRAGHQACVDEPGLFRATLVRACLAVSGIGRRRPEAEAGVP